jgi:hypothetical protein
MTDTDFYGRFIVVFIHATTHWVSYFLTVFLNYRKHSTSHKKHKKPPVSLR